MTQEFLLQNSWLIALVVGSGMMLIFPAFTGGGIKRASVAQATLMMNQKKAVLIDIREEEMADKMGHLGGAKRLNAGDIESKLPGLVKNKDTPVIVACQVGQRSQGAAKKIQALGYTEVYSLDGGANAWVDAGMPVKKKAEATKK